jgi:RNA polymerase sigma factor (sigma-70 family)
MPTANISDVILQSWEQDVAALEQEFERIFREHYQTVYRTAYGVLGNGHDAEDVAQTVFLRLVRGKSSPELKKNPGAYLYRAAVNESLNVIRARRRHSQSDAAERYEAQRALTPSAESAEALHRRLYEAVAELKPGAAQILIMRYVHNCSDAEIAKRLGTSRGTIAVSLYRSRARLRKLMRASLPGAQS